MNRIKKNSLIYLFILVVLLLSSCKDGTQQTTSVNNNKVNFQNIEQASTIQVKQNSSNIEITKEDNTWKLVNTDIQDDMPNQFVAALSSIKGDKVKIDDDLDLFLEVTADQTELKLYTKENEFYLVEQDQTYHVKNVPNLVKYYSPIIFSEDKVFLIEVDDIIQVSFDGEQGDYTLNQQSSSSSVEKAPFISGWYLHDYYEQEYSVEYNKMEEILNTLAHLKVLKQAQDINQNELTKWADISVKDEIKEYTLQLLKDGKNQYFATINNEESLLSISRGQVENLLNKPLTIIDKFVCLIMADALDEWTVKGEEEFKITASHQLNRTSDKIISNFQLNNRNIEEDEFRKMYQYVAALSAEEEYIGEALEPDPYLEMTYRFTSDGKEHSRTLEYYTLKENERKVAIKENGNIDFIMKKDQLTEMQYQLEAVNK